MKLLERGKVHTVTHSCTQCGQEYTSKLVETRMRINGKYQKVVLGSKADLCADCIFKKFED